MKYWCSSDTVLQMLLFSGWRPQDRADCQTICSFSPSLLATFATSNPIGRKYAILTIFFKALIISRLNFIDTYFGPKTGLKKPKRDCKKAVVAMQLRPLRLSSVALLQVRRAGMEKSMRFSGNQKLPSRSGWRILPDAFLLILFTTIR